MIESDILASTIEKHIKSTIEATVQAHVDQTIAKLNLDANLMGKIESLLNLSLDNKISQRINLMSKRIDEGITRWQQDLKEDFRQTSILDQSDKVEMVIMNDTVVVENELVANNLTVASDGIIEGTLNVNNLVVRGAINTDNRSWDELTDLISQRLLDKIAGQWKDRLVQEVLNVAKTQGIEFDQVLLQGKPLVDAQGKLSDAVTHSSLTTVGKLKSLEVQGRADFNDTLSVKDRRVGVNTQQPDMALSIWDEEVSLGMGKISKNQAYIGTTRGQGLTIGVNRVSMVEIDTEGLVSIKDLRLGRHKINFSNMVPGYQGTRGDIIFNSDPKPDMPFAWVCLGGYKWQAIRSA